MAFILTEEAKKDLDELWDYTFDNWGIQQADKYTSEMEGRFGWLTENVQLGQKRDDIEEGLYTYPQGRHFVVYRESKLGIEIVRVLHQSMDIEYRLEKEKPGID